MTPPVYVRVLGASFAMLPPRVRELHDLASATRWRGRADVTRGTSWGARLLAAVFRLPPRGRDQSLVVAFTPAPTHEVWERAFPAHRFVSRQYPAGARILETVGPVTLVLRPAATADGLVLAMEGARLFSVPLPWFLVPTIATREFERDGRYHFDVAAELPMIGLLIHYAGWLERETGAETGDS